MASFSKNEFMGKHPKQVFSERPIINKLDHQIFLQGGSTSALEFTQKRLEETKTKGPILLTVRVEELTKELGYMRQEIQFYRKCYESLQYLREEIFSIYQQIFLANYLEDLEKTINLTSQLYQVIMQSMICERKATQNWMDFWGIIFNSSSEENFF